MTHPKVTGDDGAKRTDRTRLVYNPFLTLEEVVGVVEHVAKLMAQVAQNLGAAGTLEVANLFDLDRFEFGPG